LRRLWLAALALAGVAHAEDAPPPAPSDEIVVTALKGMWSLEGKRIRAAQAAFAAGQPRYAPGSRLLFQILPKGGRSLDGLTLTLRNGDDILPVEPDGEHRFALPPLDSDGWRLTANRTPAEMGVRIWVLSPGTGETDRRVGDLRLHCRVGWALIQDRFNFIQRGLFNAVGGCDSSRIMIYMGTTRPLASASVTAPDGKSRPLDVDKGLRYRMPIADKDLPDGARVRLTFR